MGVLLLAAQKPIKRPGWWKEKFALFWMSATAVGVGWSGVEWEEWGDDTLIQRPILAPLLLESMDERFCRLREGATGRNSTVSSDSCLEIDYW